MYKINVEILPKLFYVVLWRHLSRLRILLLVGVFLTSPPPQENFLFKSNKTYLQQCTKFKETENVLNIFLRKTLTLDVVYLHLLSFLYLEPFTPNTLLYPESEDS